MVTFQPVYFSFGNCKMIVICVTLETVLIPCVASSPQESNIEESAQRWSNVHPRNFTVNEKLKLK